MQHYTPDNKIDKLLKEKIKQIPEGEFPLNWDKESSWERLQQKRKKKRRFKFYYYAAAILIVGFLLGSLYQSKLNTNNSGTNEVANSFEEYQKRQKLAEIEAKMSGDYYSYEICSTCDGVYYQVIKDDRPVKFEYFVNSLN